MTMVSSRLVTPSYTSTTLEVIHLDALIPVIGEPTCLANLTWLTAKIYYLGDNFVQNEYSVDKTRGTFINSNCHKYLHAFLD